MCTLQTNEIRYISMILQNENSENEQGGTGARNGLMF